MKRLRPKSVKFLGRTPVPVVHVITVANGVFNAELYIFVSTELVSHIINIARLPGASQCRHKNLS